MLQDRVCENIGVGVYYRSVVTVFYAQQKNSSLVTAVVCKTSIGDANSLCENFITASIMHAQKSSLNAISKKKSMRYELLIAI